ncbi:MAG: SPOR domain-containing protein, partial [Desulfuromonadales bacterium]|nr:SPOR domain-containing protein [Desulfuromonadales bacterium]
PAPVEPTKVAEPAAQVTGGVFALDAGSYLLESNRDALVAKIKKLGYKPLVTPVDATLDMTRLRLGTFGKDEVQEALDFARTIEPGAYSAPAGDGYVVYAGTFLKSGNVDRLTQRFLKEGIKVRPEPVQVVRTLNRIRFGGFATKEDAAAAARELAKSGLKAEVVKSK